MMKDKDMTYNIAFACMNCESSFKRPIDLAEDYKEKLPCPQCGGNAYNFGRHFKPPKKNDKKQWEKIRFLFQHGFRFQKVYPADSNTISIPYPKTLQEAKEFVIKYEDQAIKSSEKS